MPVTLERFGLDRLPPEDRWELLGLIWDSLAEAPPPVPEWHVPILKARLVDADANPDDVVPWNEAKARLLGGP